MTQLIVALDIDDASRFVKTFHACREAGGTFFKINALALLLPWWGGGQDPIGYIRSYGCDVMLDLKLYDTVDTVHAVARRAFELGARFLTVYAAPSMLEAAMRARPPGDYHKVLAVSSLTDNPGFGDDAHLRAARSADGLICSRVGMARWYKKEYADLAGKIFVCPGIRLLTTSSAVIGGHVYPATRAEAKAAGADYIVVGRPIIEASDFAAAARGHHGGLV